MQKCLIHIIISLLSYLLNALGRKQTICCLSVTVSCLLYTPLRAQQPIFIPREGDVFLHGEDTVGIFGNVLNEGRFGTQRGSVIDFLGQKWQNTSLSLLPGSGGINTSGGLFRFMGRQRQFLSAGYNFNTNVGPSFPNIAIENEQGLQLEDLNDLHIRGKLHFNDGCLFLNGWNALVDDSITGYSEEGFVVTGSQIGGGRLYRKPSEKDTLLIFPIGTTANSYSPLAISSSQSFSGIAGARVFDHVYEKAVNGRVMDSNYVKKTWSLSGVQGKERTVLLLQHDEVDEGILFSPYRDSSYISLYSIINSEWDRDSLAHDVLNPGRLTTGKLLDHSYLNNRFFPLGLPNETPDSVTWLSVSNVSNRMICPVADFKLWAAQRYNYRWVQLFWRTLRELNVKSYEVQRRRDTARKFQTIATFKSKGSGGFSNHLLYYYYADDNTYDGWTYYRLKITSASNCIVYTGLQDVPWGIGIKVWPNPSPGDAYVQIQGIKHPIIIRLMNTLGQSLRQYTMNKDGILDIKDLPDAVYFLIFYDTQNSNHKITTVKLVVQRPR